MSKLIKQFPLNTSGRDFVIGDLHGCTEQLSLLMNIVSFDKRNDRIFAVGDLIDRGPSSFEALRLLTQPWFFSVLANHEHMMLDALHTGRQDMWLQNGGDWFLELSDVQREGLFKLLPIVESLPWLITVDLPNSKRFHVMHAELQPVGETTDGDILADFDEMSQVVTWDGPVALWGRSHFRGLCGVDLTPRNLKKHRRSASLQKADAWMQTARLSDIFVGHTPLNAPVRFDKLVNIDTHAYGLFMGRYKRCGLTMCEPLTQRFWIADREDAREVECLVVPDIKDSRDV